jgi:cation:H+ antiporter
MSELVLLLSIIVSIAFISKGSDWLTDSLIPIAKKLKTTSISIGLILISIVVSLPEILVAVYATFSGYKDIGLGVAFGSIICNIGLMTGLSAIIRPLKVTRNMLLRDGIFSVVVPILIFALASDGQITRIEGLATFLLFIPYLMNVFLQEKGIARQDFVEEKREVEVELDLIGWGYGKMEAGWFSFTLGLTLLLSGTYLFAFQLTQIVEIFSVDALFIGMTLGTIVPSIPNIAAAYKATKRGLTEVAVSETIGSNIFTLLVTLGIISMLSPVVIKKQWLVFDLPVMTGMSFLLFFFSLTHSTINKKEGFILFGSYIGILIFQILLFMK